MEADIFEIINKMGFPIFIAVILLYDKIKTNGSLRRVVENNNYILCEIKEQLKGGA